MSCKVPIDTGLLDLDAPSVGAFEWRYYSHHVYMVCCDHCGVWNNHGPFDGHRYTHCVRDDCPYKPHGYNMCRVGQILSIGQFARRVRASPRTIRSMIESNEIGAMVYKSRLFVPAYDLAYTGYRQSPRS